MGACALSACSPDLNWREVRLAGADAQLLFPCKPRTETRSLTLAGAKVQMSMHGCETGGVTYALAHADMTDPARVTPALQELRLALAGKVGGTPQIRPWQPVGATPSGESSRWRTTAQLPGGQGMKQEVAFFAYGTRVFQLVAQGPALTLEASDTFFDSLKLAL